jgi:hypothetical protein
MLAHQGGWDETLMIIAPMLVVVFLLRLAKRRVERNQLRPDETAPGAEPSDQP